MQPDMALRFQPNATYEFQMAKNLFVGVVFEEATRTTK
jgi:hypothetical protein